LGITLARDFTWVEQQSKGAVGLRWIELDVVDFFFLDFDFAPVCLSAAHLGRRM